MTTQHTPTPHADYGPYQQGNYAPHRAIYTCEEDGPVLVATCRTQMIAKHITEACNAHDALTARVAELEKQNTNLMVMCQRYTDRGAELWATLQSILIHSDTSMATGSRDITDWQDDNRLIGDIARAALGGGK
jgi:hypothetical protein